MKYELKDGKLYYVPKAKPTKKGEKATKVEPVEYTPWNAGNLDWDQLQKEIQVSLNTLYYNVAEKGQATPINVDTLASIYVKKMQGFARKLIEKELANAN